MTKIMSLCQMHQVFTLQIPSDSKDLEAIDVKFTSDLEVPHAQSIFTMPSKGVEISIAYFTKT